MMKDVGLLGERVRNLQGHFGQTNKDIDDILISTGKIEKRAAKIEELEFDSEPPSAEVIPVPIRKLEAGSDPTCHSGTRAEASGPEIQSGIESFAILLWIPGSRRFARAPE